MALELRPNCELCDRDLPPDSNMARICANECTWCADCSHNVLFNVCPNCGGELVWRPIRPANAYRPGEGLAHNPASTVRRHTKYSREEIADFVAKLKDVPPELR